MINCKNCNNPLAKENKDNLEVFNKRVSFVEVDFHNQKATVKCRNCGYFSNISKDLNELDLKKTSLNLL